MTHPRHRRWTKEEEEFLRSHVDMKDAEALQSFEARFECQISLYAYQKKRRDMGLQKGHGRGRTSLRGNL